MVAPVFHKLTGQFNSIPLYIVDAGCQAVVHGGEHVVQAMAKFVEERFDLVKTHQCRFAVDRRRLVADEIGHWETHCVPGGSKNAAAPDTLIHPRPAALLGRSAVRVKIKGHNGTLLVIVDAEEAHIFVPYSRFSRCW